MTQKELTPYGVEVRKMRIEAQVKLADHAKFVGKSAALLSGMETGRKTITEEVIKKTIQYFARYDINAEQLWEKAELSKKEFAMMWDDYALEDRRLLHQFASRFPSLSEQQKDLIREIVNKDT